jgi:radical SAM protein with 4Fe4S-binding SPASM domain
MEKIKIPETYNYIAVFPTMKCNLSCSFCLNAFDKKFDRKNFEEISGEEWVRALNKIDSRPEVPITFSGGEPSLHKEFIYILKNLKSEINIDILTNLYWNENFFERFISEINPDRIKRNSPYASIRASYHPEQMGNGKKLIENAVRLKNAGFNVGIWAVLYPSPEQLSSINQMQFRCRDENIDFRVKEFTGEYKGEIYGNYSKYPEATSGNLESCLCKISELLIGPNGNVYRCHRDLYAEEFPQGNVLYDRFEIKDSFKKCGLYGSCHPCDVKVKTNYKQEIGHTSVNIIK